ncbi:MAG: TetR/AcrR family transcriptional regulator [Cellvibrionaceae bacterium]
MNIAKTGARPKRRTNAERSAETKDKIIKAAVRCLYNVGYDGTSISGVAAEAGVSKGATQHHFPSKVDLMLAVADYSLKMHVQIRQDIFVQYQPGPERIAHTADASWEIINHPTYTALIEIMMATRNSPELKKRCRPLIDLIAAERRRGEEAFCRDFEVEPNTLLSTLIRTHVTAMRGIAVGLMFNPDRDGFREELEMMQRYERMMRDFIIKEYGKERRTKNK